MSKSFVTMEQAICPVCGVAHDTGSLLLGSRLRDTFEEHTATHYGLCPEHKKLRDDGYIALVEAKPMPGRSAAKLHEPNRTGSVAHVRLAVWGVIFNVPAPEGGVCFVEPGVIEMLQANMEMA